MDPQTMTHQERLQFINSLRGRVEQTHGRSPEELTSLAERGIIPPSDEELELGIRVLRLVRLGSTVAPPAAQSKKAALPPGVALDDF